MKLAALIGLAIALICVAAHEQSTVSAANLGFSTTASDCCDCDPTASDQACFAQCNAMLPRCRAAAPRPAAPPPKQVMTFYCCNALSQRYRIRVAVPLGAHCGQWGPYWFGCL
jgi:hypothetical protein